jgi:hypothetical protein
MIVDRCADSDLKPSIQTSSIWMRSLVGFVSVSDLPSDFFMAGQLLDWEAQRGSTGHTSTKPEGYFRNWVFSYGALVNFAWDLQAPGITCWWPSCLVVSTLKLQPFFNSVLSMCLLCDKSSVPEKCCCCGMGWCSVCHMYGVICIFVV